MGIHITGYSHNFGQFILNSIACYDRFIVFLSCLDQCWVPGYGSCHNVQAFEETGKEIRSRYSQVSINSIHDSVIFSQTLDKGGHHIGSCDGYSMDW